MIDFWRVTIVPTVVVAQPWPLSPASVSTLGPLGCIIRGMFVVFCFDSDHPMPPLEV